MSKPLQTLCSVDTGHATISFLGRLLGTTTSRQDGHFHPIDRHASRGERCYACRWSEYRLYEVDRGDRQKIGGRYLVVSYGHSTVPDETTLRRVLHSLGYRWKRPRYVLARRDPERAGKKESPGGGGGADASGGAEHRGPLRGRDNPARVPTAQGMLG